MLTGGLLVTCLCSCGSSASALDTGAVERAIAVSILTQRRVHTTVACPAGVPRRAGLVFTCTAMLDVGSYPVTVTQVNGSGQVRYESPAPFVILNIARIQDAIARSILAQRHLSASVNCPGRVLQQAGLVFTCSAAIRARRYPFEVVEVDGRGHVRYTGR